MTTALALLGITKRFGSVTALDGADFIVAPGEVHGLLGENGAGKSTLMQVAFGLVRPDAGTVSVRGIPAEIRSPADARRLGLGMVHQHFTSIPALTVEENLWLAAGRHGHPAGRPGPAEDDTAAGRLRRRLWEGLDPRTRVESLSVGAKQRLELLQAVATGADILLLDEPTAVLAPPEVDELLRLLRAFTAAGGSAVLITHKLGEVLAAVDRVTVLRAGRVVSTMARRDATAARLAADMVGEGGGVPTPEGGRGRPLGTALVSSPRLLVASGEIVGVVAVEGNGERELLRTVAGVMPRPSDLAVAEPVAFVPEDRTTEGLAPGFTLTENLVLGLSRDPRWVRGPWLDWAAAGRRTAELIAEFGIRAGGADVPARTLSGGNQQKLVFARALDAAPRVLVAENPTRGLDVHATAFVHEGIRSAARRGVAVLVYSADLDEVLGLADRIVVLHRGRVLPVPPGSSRDAIGSLMTGAG